MADFILGMISRRGSMIALESRSPTSVQDDERGAIRAAKGDNSPFRPCQRVILTAMRRRGENGFPYRPQVLERTFALLDVLADSTQDLSWAQMEGRLNFDKSTYYRLLRTLEHHRYAERDTETGKYRLGSKLLELGSRAAARFDLATAGRPYLERLSDQSGETALLGVFRDNQVVSLNVVEGRHALRMGVTVGGKAAVHCSAIGKAILAFLPEDVVDSIVRESGLKRYTRHTITRRSKFKAELVQVRSRGFAMDNQELEAGLKCIAAAVQDQSGKVIAALSIAGAALRFNRKRVATLAPLVSRMASDFSASLGYRPGPIVAPPTAPIKTGNGSTSLR
jgi:IclR family transcriptional regulator, KDG regulon repressor